MCQTLFYIPDKIDKFPMFGMGGLLTIAWTLFCIGLVAFVVRKHGFGRELQSYAPILIGVWLVLIFRIPNHLLVIEGYGIPIRGYGVLMLVGVIAGVGLAVYRARQMGVDPEIIFSLAIVLFVTAIVGARVFYVIQYWNEQFKADTWIETLQNVANVTQGGLVVYGSLVGGLAGGLWFLNRHQLPILALGDLIAPSLLVGLAIGRIGCLMNGCCFGGACERPWAVTFPFLSPPYQEQLASGETEALGLRLRDVQIDEDGEVNTVVVVSEVDPRGIAYGKGLEVGNEITHIDKREVTSAAYAQHILTFPRSRLEIEQRGLANVILELPRSRPIHPTQVYSAINATLLAALLWIAYPFCKRDGAIIALLLTLYPITRFMLEAIRTDEPGRFHTGMTISQLVSLGIGMLAVGLWIYLFRHPSEPALPGQKPLTLAVRAQS